MFPNDKACNAVKDEEKQKNATLQKFRFSVPKKLLTSIGYLLHDGYVCVYQVKHPTK